jgi:hypothetical protein
MKKLYKPFLVIGTIGFMLLTMLRLAGAADILRLRGTETKPAPVTLTLQKSATTTATVEIPKFVVTTLDTNFGNQGSCMKLKDSDGIGYTFLIVNDGVATFSTASCE